MISCRILVCPLHLNKRAYCNGVFNACMHCSIYVEATGCIMHFSARTHREHERTFWDGLLRISSDHLSTHARLSQTVQAMTCVALIGRMHKTWPSLAHKRSDAPNMPKSDWRRVNCQAEFHPGLTQTGVKPTWQLGLATIMPLNCFPYAS